MKRRSFLGFLSLFPFAPSQAKKILDQANPKVSFAIGRIQHTVKKPEEYTTTTTTTYDPYYAKLRDECLEANYKWNYQYDYCTDQYGGILLPRDVNEYLNSLNKG